MQFTQSIDRVGRSATLDLERRKVELVVAADRRPAQRQPGLGAGIIEDLLVRRGVDRHQYHAVEPELRPRLLGADQMPDVRGVEGPPEDPHGGHGYGRTWPSPMTTYLNAHSSRMPIGPRAWSFWVELPISAPMPNSPPSVKRVEALT